MIRPSPLQRRPAGRPLDDAYLRARTVLAGHQFSAARNKTLAYVANENGDLEAIDTADGAIVWSDAFGVPMHATPAYRALICGSAPP